MSFEFLAQGIVESFRPVPSFPGYSLNANLGPWAPGAPIPEGTVCMRRLPMSYSTSWWALRNDPEVLQPDVTASLLLAGLCDDKGQPFIPSLPPNTDGTPCLRYTVEQRASIMNHLTWELGEHIRKCITDYCGWSTFGKLTPVVEDDAKN